MILFILIIVLGFIIQLLLPWWSLIIVAFLLSFLLGKKLLQVIITAFLACGLTWLLMECYIYFTHGSLMTERIASLLTLHGSILLYMVTFIIAGIAGASAAVTGFLLKEALKKDNLIPASW